MSGPPATDQPFDVRRVSGLLPPGVTKQFTGTSGVTRWGGRRFGTFDVVAAGDGYELRYRVWPIIDRIRQIDGEWTGEGTIGGRIRFCRFRLTPRTVRAARDRAERR